MPLKLPDLTQVLQETTRRGSGAIRWQQPRFVAFLPPCSHECPAGEDIQAWLGFAQAGDYETAWRKLVEANPLPATHGRACYHTCENACNRTFLDAPVAIHAIERFLGDLAVEKGWRIAVAPPSGKSALVVGAGPAGLSCAYHLARAGCRVEIRDAAEEPGGMMAYGIPAYRLPRDIMRKEVARIAALPGITLKSGQRVDDVVAARKDGGFDAVFVAVGAQVANHINIPARDGKRLIEAIGLLGDVERGKAPVLGRVVAVIGGGNVAMDAARTALRLGAAETVLVYISDPAHLEAHPEEAQAAFAEGAKIKWMSAVEQFGAQGVVIEKLALNADGGVVPTGETERLAADSVILAVGEHADLSLMRSAPDVAILPGGMVGVDAIHMTGQPGIFAGGDCIGGARTMTAAVGHGKLAARAMLEWMDKKTYQHPASHPLVTFEMLHLLDYLDAPREEQRETPLTRRTGFGEIVAGLDEPQARSEAMRCLSCGNCFECDNCYAACPEQAIARLGPGRGYEVDLTLCSGCAVCFEQCPCHAIEMTPEPAAPQDLVLASRPIGSLGEPIAPSRFKVRL
jgi:NADPH-dependent glutamate synthase beta subunit-like oxidoreductase